MRHRVIVADGHWVRRRHNFAAEAVAPPEGHGVCYDRLDHVALRQVLMHHLDNKRAVVIDQLRAVRHSIDSTPDASFQTEGHAP